VKGLRGAAGDRHKGDYHIGTISVKENLQLTQGKGDPFER
jgi:hypothetical protein